MGLISWIKDKYYDSQLNKADELVLEKELERAEDIYRKLLGKQEQAVVNLANMLATHSNSVEEKLKALKDILDLKEYTDEFNEADYKKELDSHVSNMEKYAVAQFNGEHYHEAVLIADAIKQFRNNNAQFSRTLHQYHAYLAFQTSQQRTSYDTSLSEVIQELKLFISSDKGAQINTLVCGHINHFVSILNSGHRFSREIKLLLPFIDKDTRFKENVLTSIVSIIKGEDSEVKAVKSLSDICTDTELCIEAANYLAKLSSESAKSKDYKLAVLYDSHAAEYLSSNNSFNYERCVHILEEQSKRASAKEVSALLSLAKKLNLTDTQISNLTERISQIASNAEPQKGIDICRLFIQDPVFGVIYITQAEKLVASGNSAALDEKELLDVINKNTDEDSLPDTLIPFVGSISGFEQIFIESSINKILKHKRVSLLEDYWKVKESVLFFSSLITDHSDLSLEVIKTITANHKFFLHNKSLKSEFFRALNSLNDDEYAQGVAEKLIKNKCNINEFYVEIVLKRSSKKEVKESLQIINSGLNVVTDQLLLNKKKELIRNLIATKDFDLAEKEAKSLQGIEKEAATLMAELYFAKGLADKDPLQKKNFFFAVLDVCEKGDVFDSFIPQKDEVLSNLSMLSLQAFTEDRIDVAYEIVDRIKSYQDKWLSLYIQLRNRELDKIDSLGQKIKHEGDSIAQIIATIANLKDVDEPLYLGFWNNYLNHLLQKSKSQPKDRAIESLVTVRKQVIDYCPEVFAKDVIDNLTKEVVKFEWSYATELEADLEYDKATQYYEAIKLENVPSYKGRAELRALICCVKSGNVTDIVGKRISSALDIKSHESLKDDLAYRYACYLLRSTKPSEAENLLKKYLPNESSLLNLCENIYIKESEKYLLEFNKKIKTVIEGTMTVSEATSFLEEIDKYKDVISNKLTDTASKFDSYKSKLESYILRGMFNEEQYETAFAKLLSMYPNYIEDDSQLRNIAIAALGLVESGKAKDKDIKYAISIWLSAVYTDRLFVKSLDYTSWDDDLTFTLLGSLGQTNDYDYDNLPDNINFDPPIDNQNVAIKDVQESLVLRMETCIRDSYPQYEAFFNDEKEALDNLIDLRLEQDYILASPYLASKLARVKKSIKKALDYDVSQGYDTEEEALDLGVRYGFTGNEYTSYQEAQQKAEKCKSAMSGSLANLRSAFAAVSQIKGYSKMFASLKSFVSSRMNDDIKSKMEYKKFIDHYEVVCKTFNDAQLSLKYSNHANGEIIQRLNKDQMDLKDGVVLMVRVYNVAPTSIQVKQNLEGMLCALAIQAEQNNNSSEKAVVDKAVRDTGNIFQSKVDDARVQASLSDIVDKVNGGRLAKDKALKEVYELYKKNPNNDRICENLVTLCDICIMEYIVADKWGASSVKSILDSLNNNKSAAFKRHNGQLAKTYLDIWGKLSADNRMLMMGLGRPGTSLNSNGLALKSGLEYLKKLGDVKNTRSGLLGGIFDDLPF